MQLIGFPFFESQAIWIAQLLSGKRTLPSYVDMMESIKDFYHSKDIAGIPKHNTHDLANFEVKLYIHTSHLPIQAHFILLPLIIYLLSINAVLWQIWRQCWVPALGRMEERALHICPLKCSVELGGLQGWLERWGAAASSPSEPPFHSIPSISISAFCHMISYIAVWWGHCLFSIREVLCFFFSFFSSWLSKMKTEHYFQ